MTKELRELFARLEQARTEVRSLMGEDKLDEAEKRMAEVRDIQKKIAIQKDLDEEERSGMDLRDGKDVGGTQPEKREDAELEKEYRSVFLRGLRRQEVSSEQRSIIREYEERAVMNEGGTNPAIPTGNSSLIVPQDTQTKIHTLMRSFNDLSQYVNVQTVSALSGSRVLEKDQTMTPFEEIEEYGVIGEMDNPQFVPVAYKIKKRAGILPLTNELLADTDQNLLAYVENWIAKKAVVTNNTLITNLLKTMTKEDVANVDQIKRVLNVKLDPAISLSSILLTNQDGYQWLDEQKDDFGRDLLQDDITKPGRKLFRGRPVAVVANRFLQSDMAAKKAPLIIGDLHQLIILFTRKLFEITSTREGGDAFRRDTTDLRTIMRNDIQLWDEDAAKFTQLDISEIV